MSASEARFADIDADGNGSVSRDEWKAAHERMRERYKQMREQKESE